ncbi:hypothetical protein ABKN59_009090 [Abortiporus biennis]
MLLYTDSYPYYFQYVHSKAHKTTREMALTGKGHTISYPEGKYYINKLITYDLVTLQKITSDSLPKGYEPDWIPFTIKVLIASNILDEHPEEARVFIEWMDELAAFYGQPDRSTSSQAVGTQVILPFMAFDSFI